MGTLEDSNRLAELGANGLVSGLPDRDFDDIAFLAAQLCQAPVSFISLQGGGQHFVKSVFGQEVIPQLSGKMIQHFAGLTSEGIVHVEDFRLDARFKSSLSELDHLGLRSFAGITLKISGGDVTCTLGIFDLEPRSLTDTQLSALEKLAKQAVSLIESGKTKLDLERSKRNFEKERLRLYKIIDSAEVGTWEWCLDTGEFRYSERWASMIGYTSGELGEITKQKRDSLLHPNDLEDSNKVLDDYLSGELPVVECEVRMKHKSGYWVWVLIRGEIITDSLDSPGRWMVGTHTDTTDRVVANEQIYIREKRFKILLENSEDAIAILNRQGKPNFETESAFKILGIDPKEESNESIKKLVHPEDRKIFDDWFQKSLDNPGQPVKGTIIRVRHRNGTWHYISGTLTNLLNDSVIKGIIHNFKDVTEEVLGEERRQKTEKRFRVLAQEGADLVSILSKEGVYQYVSPNYPAYLGFSEEELVGKNAFDFMHPEDLERVQEEYSGIYRKRQIRSSPFRFRHQAEGWRWVQSVATNMLDDPDIQGIVINSVDVTALIEAQKALEMSNERFTLALKAGSESIYDFNPKSNTVFLSETFEETFGIKIGTGEKNFQLIFDRIHPDDLDRSISEFRKAMENPEVTIWIREYRLLKGDGTYAFVRDRSIKLVDGKGKPVRVVGALMDMSRSYFFQKLGEIEKEFIESSLLPGSNEKDLYRKYLLNLESLIPDMRASILHVEEGRLRNFISPSLPKELIDRIESLPIGPNQGSCGTAAYLNEKVFVTDVYHDPRWENFQELARNFRIGACWSFPIINSEGKVVATIANYYSKGKEVGEKEQQALERAQRLVSLLMAQFENLEKIRLINERYEFLNKSTNEAIFDWDVQKDKFHWGESLSRVFGHDYKSNDFDLKKWTSLMHPSDDLEKAKEWNSFLGDPGATKWQNQFRFLKKDGSYAFVEELAYVIRDEFGLPVRMIGVLRDQTELKVNQLGKELQEKISALFREDLSLHQILTNLLKTLSRFGEFSGAEFWLSEKENTALNLLGYQVLKESLSDFFSDEERIAKISFGKGLPGKVWSSQTVQVWENLGQNPDFLRGEAAKKVGIKTAVGIPVRSDEQMLGVLVLVSERKIAKDWASLKILETLQGFLGNEIRRKRQEVELKLFFESSPDILAIASPNGYFTKVNPAFCQILGYTEKELTFVPFEQFLHPEDKPGTKVEFEETIDGSRLSNNFINRYRMKSGEYRFISWSSSKSYGPDNFVFAYGKDVTELKKMEVLLANASKLSRVGGWELDMINNRQMWSPITCEIHEVPVGFIPSVEEGINFYRADYREKVARLVSSAAENGEKFDFEAPILTAKGNERWVRAIGEAEFVGDKCIRIFGSIQDIQERKLMEERLKGVSDSIPGVIFQYVLKPDGTDELRYVSKGSEQVWGLSPEECMADSSKIWAQVAQGGDMAILQKSIQDSAKTLNYWNCEWRVMTPEGKIKWLEGLGAPNKKADGSVVWDSLVTEVTERKNLENLLDQSARMAKIGSWELDLFANPVMLNWSTTTQAILEYPDLTGIELDRAFEAYSGESKEIARNCMKNLIENGTGFDVELELISGSGNSKWIRCIGQALQVNGKVLSAYGSFQDIHDRKLAELNLKSLLLERNTILESIGDGFFAVDRAFTVTYWNNQAERLAHVQRQEILGKNLWEVFEPAKNKESFKNYHLALETGKVISFEDYLEDVHSWFSVSAFPSSSGLTVYFKDITQSKNAQEEIRKSNDRFERVSEATNDAIWDYQVQEDKLYWGKGFLTLFGYDPEKEKLSMEFFISLIHPQDRSRIVAAVQESMADPEFRNWHEEYRFKKSDGTYAYVVDRAIFSRGPVGEPVRIIGAMSDITERKEFEVSLKKLNTNLKRQAKELAISNSELEQFAYVASHDLQEPLRMVSSFLSQLERKYKDQLDEKAKEYIHYAVDGAVRMRNIILDLLEYSRVGKHEKVLEEINLEELIREVTRLQSQLIAEKEAIIKFEGAGLIVGFKAPMLQVFQNLIGNALKYSKEGVPPLISINCKDENDHWLLSVSDNGIGVKEEYFDKIFIIFQRLHRKEEYSGTGMGLAIVKKIIEGLGGRIWLESVYTQGTTFHFTIPKPIK